MSPSLDHLEALQVEGAGVEVRRGRVRVRARAVVVAGRVGHVEHGVPVHARRRPRCAGRSRCAGRGGRRDGDRVRAEAATGTVDGERRRPRRRSRSPARSPPGDVESASTPTSTVAPGAVVPVTVDGRRGHRAPSAGAVTVSGARRAAAAGRTGRPRSPAAPPAGRRRCAAISRPAGPGPRSAARPSRPPRRWRSRSTRSPAALPNGDAGRSGFSQACSGTRPTPEDVAVHRGEQRRAPARSPVCSCVLGPLAGQHRPQVPGAGLPVRPRLAARVAQFVGSAT